MRLTVNYLKFLTFKQNVGHQGCNSQNACQNRKQGDPDQTASSEAV